MSLSFRFDGSAAILTFAPDAEVVVPGGSARTPDNRLVASVRLR